MATILKSISVSMEYHELAKKYNLSWTEAARIGVSVMLGDLGIKPYDNDLNLKRKVDMLIQEIQHLHKKIDLRKIN